MSEDRGILYPVREIENIKEMLVYGAENYGSSPAFLVKEKKGGPYREISYGKVLRDMDALGTKLLDMGLAGARIAVIGENSYEWMLTYFTAVCGVGAIVPLDKELKPQEIQNLINAAECSAIFYSSSFEKKIENLDIPMRFKFEVYRNDEVPYGENDMEQMIYEGKKLLSRGRTDYRNAVIDAEKAGIFLFTSGTTGTPKAVMMSHRNIVSNVMNISRIVKLSREDRTLSILPIHHTFESTVDIMTVLYQGGSVAFFEGLKYVTKNLQEAQATILVGVPLIFESIYAKIWKQAEKTKKAGALRHAVKLNRRLRKVGIDQRRRLFGKVYDTFGGRLRMIITGAAAIDPNVIRGFQDLGFETAQGYGLTETAPLIAGTPDGTDQEKHKKAGSVGPAVPGGEIRIEGAGEDGIGEILYRGPNVMLGYYNMPQETAEVLKDGWFHTGDLGFLDENGWLYITGRKKNVIVTKTGKNIYPEELEQRINELRYVKECMVYGEEGADPGDGTEVAVQIRPDYEQIREDFPGGLEDEKIYPLLKSAVSKMNQSLANYKRVRHVVIRDTDFVKTTTHKIKRQENVKSAE